MQVKGFISKLSYQLLELKGDYWGFISLRLILGDWRYNELYYNPSADQLNTMRMDISLNYITTLIEHIIYNINPSQESR